MKEAFADELILGFEVWMFGRDRWNLSGLRFLISSQ